MIITGIMHMEINSAQQVEIFIFEHFRTYFTAESMCFYDVLWRIMR